MSVLRPIRTRVLGPLIAAVFAVANLGLPAADVLVDHSLDRSRTAAQAHLEGLNGCQEHVDHCTLARMLGAVRLQATPASTTAFLPAADAARAEPLRSGVPSAPHLPFYLSRAPPQAA